MHHFQPASKNIYSNKHKYDSASAMKAPTCGESPASLIRDLASWSANALARRGSRINHRPRSYQPDPLPWLRTGSGL